MKKSFTVYVPDDCKMEFISVTVIVRKENGENGLTLFSQDNRQRDVPIGNAWLFVPTSEAVKVGEEE